MLRLASFRTLQYRAYFSIFVTTRATMKTKLFLLLLLSMFLKHQANAQLYFNRTDTVDVQLINGTPLKNAWAGGLNFLQVSDIDLNYDGVMDLFLLLSIVARQIQLIIPTITVTCQSFPNYKAGQFYAITIVMVRWIFLRTQILE
jgi:hypothetical protein